MNDAMALLSILSTGLVAGLMYGWTTSVLPGLRHVDDRTYLTTMQTINRRIINPAFTVPFTITPVILAVAAVVFFNAGQTRQGWLLATSAATYALGVIGVTVGGNIPLNNDLDTFDLHVATDETRDQQRRRYEGPWNRWHYARTAASVGALTLAATAAINGADEG